MNENNFDDEDRLYYEGLGDELALPQPKATTLPKVVEQYVKSAADVSKYNEIPAAIGFFVILGQLAKDMVAIPSGRRVDDTRIQFIWMQTSGTGKTEMYNFFGPVANEVFRIIEDKYGVNYDVFSVDDTTDAALIGSMRIEKERVENEDGEMEWVEIPTQIDGGFEGSGLVAYDEFEYSGVFSTKKT